MKIFYTAYIITALLMVFCFDVVIGKGSEYGEPLTVGKMGAALLLCGGIWWLRKYRDHPIIGPIYNLIKMFFIVLFAVLLFGFVKQKVKDGVKDILK